MRFTSLFRAIAPAVVLASPGCSDTTGPKSIDAPTGVTVTMVSPTTARVTWTPSAQADLVASYNVFRNGAKVGEATTTFYQDEGLAELTQYKYAVSANGKDGQVSPLSAETPSAIITVPDVTPPRVTSSSPVEGATGVPRAATISVVFSEPMDAATINASTFQVKIISGGAIPGTVAYTAATRTAQFTPSSSLPNATGISVGVTTGVKDLAGNALASNFSFGFAVRDEIAPAVVSVTPQNNATDVATNASVVTVFSEPMDAATISAASFTVRATSSGAPVAGTVSYDATARAATFAPSANLANDVSYTVGITTAAKDVAGNALQQAFSSTFSTVASSPPPPPQDSVRPTVVSSIPSNGSVNVAVTSPVRVTFSEAMNASTINGSTFSLTVGGAPVSGTVSYDSASRSATFNPSAGLLAEGQSYVATVSTVAKDLAGNSLAAAFAFGFATVAPSDNVPPTVVSRSPSPGATGVSVNTTVRIGFSEAMNASTINASTITMAGGGSSIPGAVTYDAGTRIATFTPGVTLATGQTYYVTVTTGVRDVAGNGLASNDVSGFTTEGTLQIPITGLTNPTNGWWQQTTTASDIQVHFHFVFSQVGTSLVLGPDCPGGYNDRCMTLAENQAGADAIGPPSPGYVWVLLTNASGTYVGNQISFTLTNANGKTFTFTGTVNSSLEMVGTLSGPTIPTQALTFVRSP